MEAAAEFQNLESSDQKLLASFAVERSEASFELLVSRYTNLVYSVSLRVLRDANLAEDATQAAFMVFHQQAKKLKPDTALAPWLFRVAELCARNAARTRRRQLQRDHKAKSMRPSESADNADNADSADWEEIKPHLDAAVAALPEAQRAAIVLRYFQGWTRAQIAAHYQCSERTIQSRLLLAMQKLRQSLEKRSVYASASVLSLALTHFGVQHAPAGLAAKVAGVCNHTLAPSANVMATAKATQQALTTNTFAWAAGIAFCAVALGLMVHAGAQRVAAPPAALVAAATSEKQLWVDFEHGSDANNGEQTSALKSLTRAYQLALPERAAGHAVTITVRPGVCRDALNFDPAPASGAQLAALKIEAEATGTVLITGADVWREWTCIDAKRQIYTAPWPYAWGLAPVPKDLTSIHLHDIVRRREMVFIGPALLARVMQPAHLYPGSFCVEDATAAAAGKILVCPPAGTDMQAAVVETATRASLLRITHEQNVSIRGFRFCRANPFIQQGGAVSVAKSKNIHFTQLGAEYLTNGIEVVDCADVAIGDANFDHNGCAMSGRRIENLLVRNVAMTGNCWTTAQNATYGWVAATAKWSELDGATFLNVRSHRNIGKGFWLDSGCRRVTIDALDAAENFDVNVALDGNPGPIVVKNSTIRDGMAGGLRLANSEDVTLSGTVIGNNAPYQLSLVGMPDGRAIQRDGAEVRLFAQRHTWLNNQFWSSSPAQKLLVANFTDQNWRDFKSTLKAGSNTWWSPRDTDAFSFSPTRQYDFAAWRGATGQDTSDRWERASSNPVSTLESPEIWLTTDSKQAVNAGETAIFTLKTSGFGKHVDVLTLEVDSGGAERAVKKFALASERISIPGEAVLNVETLSTAAPGTYTLTAYAYDGKSIVKAVSFSLVIKER